MTDGFSQKEMLVRILDQLEKLEEKVSETHACVRTTNGKVKTHSKLISALAGAILSFVGWFVYYISTHS